MGNHDTFSGLFGIQHSNRSTDKHWGKNCFNSSFPASVASYMLMNNIPAIYNRLVLKDGQLCVEACEVSIQEVFNCHGLSVSDLDFNFESRFEPYQQYSFDGRL